MAFVLFADGFLQRMIEAKIAVVNVQVGKSILLSCKFWYVLHKLLHILWSSIEVHRLQMFSERREIVYIHLVKLL